MKKILVLSILFAACVGCVSTAAIAEEPPVVTKVEPPSWWPNHSINPVRILIRGQHLHGAKIQSQSKCLKPGDVHVNEAGTYLFVDVKINKFATLGACPLTVETAAGSAEAPFELLKPLPRDNRFQGFSCEDVFYLLMPDRFANGDPSNDDPEISTGLLDREKSRYYHGGDLQGVIDRLPYLKDLGITALWLNPIYDNVNHLNEREVYNGRPITDYHGYGAVDFYGVEEHFGDLDLFRELVDRAHAMGIKVVQDQVANHTGPYHPWATDPPTPTWFNGTPDEHLDNTWQTWTLADPHASATLQEETLKGWFIDILPDLNQDDPETARYLIQNTLWWIGVTGIDGIRQDTLPYVHRRFWRDWTAAIKKEYPKFKTVGEMWDGSAAKVSFFQGGRPRFDGVDSGLDALFDFPLYYPLRRVFAEGQSIHQLAEAIGLDRLYEDSGMLIAFAGLHDVQRFMNEPNADFTGLKLAHTFLLAARGIPLIYYGDEIGMPGEGDPDNRRDFPGGWQEDSRNAFINEERTPEERDLFNRIRLLTQLRQELKPLRKGKTLNLYVDEWTYAFARKLDTESVIIAINNGKEPANVAIPINELNPKAGAIFVDRLGTVNDVREDNGKIALTLPPRNAAILESQ